MKLFLMSLFAAVMLLPPAVIGQTVSADADAMTLANKAVEAHGGAKIKELKTLTVIGSADITASAFNQSIPASFVTIFAGDKYRLEINNPFQPFKQVSDGVNTQSTVQNGFQLPPLNRTGFILLTRVGQKGYVVTPLADKKKTGFRMTTPDGLITDFFLDAKTFQVKGFDSKFAMNGQTYTTSAEIDKMIVVDGVTLPEKYSQRFDLPQMTIYSSFKAKDVKVNNAIADDIFTLK